MKVLLVEDEKRLANAVQYLFKQNKIDCDVANDGLVGYEMAVNNDYAVIMLDIMLPSLTGLEILSRLRRGGKNTPIIMLTAKGQEEDKVNGLSAGADDYVTKPFSVPELLARIKTNLRRVSTTTAPIRKEYSFMDIRINMVEKKVFRGDAFVQVGPTEFRILKLLISNPRQVFSREDLLKEVWGNNVYVEPRTIDVHIRRLRKALNDFGPDYIRTIRSTGYSIDDKENLGQ